MKPVEIRCTVKIENLEEMAGILEKIQAPKSVAGGWMRLEACEQIVLAIQEWLSEGDAPLQASTQLFADKTLREAVRDALKNG